MNSIEITEIDRLADAFVEQDRTNVKLDAAENGVLDTAEALRAMAADQGGHWAPLDSDEFRAAQIVDAKKDAPSEAGIWHFIAGDWLTDEEIQALGTSHEEEVQIIPSEEGGAE